MAEKESGWTDEYPHKADAGDEYYFVRRKDRNDVVVMGFSMGKAWLNGVSYEPSELRSHLFLGPISPSDAQQLIELRKEALKGVCVYCGEIQQYQSLEQKASEEGNQIRVAHIRQCSQRPELKLIAYCEELQQAAKAAHAWIARVSNQYILGADDPHEVSAQLNRVLNPQAREGDAVMAQVTTLTDHNGTRLTIEKRPLDVLVKIELRDGNQSLFYAKNEDMPELINTFCAYYDDPDNKKETQGKQ